MASENDGQGGGRNGLRRQKTRQAVVAAAAHLFQAQGLDRTTISQIAKQADVGHGSIYNHFGGLEDIAGVLAVESIERILAATAAIMASVEDARLLPCVGARVILRSFLDDVVMRWMLERPYLFTRTFEQAARAFMLSFEGPAIARGLLKPVGGHETWIRLLPWILLRELKDAVDDTRGDPLLHEATFARVCMRLMGIDDRDADALLARSLALVEARGAPSAAGG